MLRILHTADWHLGQSFHGYDRDHEHGCFLKWLQGMLTERRPDALVIAGDVFDSVNPPASAQRLFYDFLARAHTDHPGLQILLIAGNHDAAGRLEAPAELLQSLNITTIGLIDRDDLGEIKIEKLLVPLKDATGQVSGIAVAVPFLRPADVPAVSEAADAYLDGIRELYRRAVEAAKNLREKLNPQAALLALGHCHMQNGTESRDSERRIVIGGAESLRAEIFPPELAYVALGHLHKPQELDGGRIRYCGSPIPLSFSEQDYDHRVLEVTFENRLMTGVMALPIPKSALLQGVPRKAATISEVLRILGETPFDATLPPEAQPFLEVRVLDDGPDPTRRRCVEKVLEGKPVRLASIKLESPQRPASQDGTVEASMANLADLSTLDPEQIMASAFKEKYHAEPDAEILRVLREILVTEASREVVTP